MQSGTRPHLFFGLGWVEVAIYNESATKEPSQLLGSKAEMAQPASQPARTRGHSSPIQPSEEATHTSGKVGTRRKAHGVESKESSYQTLAGTAYSPCRGEWS